MDKLTLIKQARLKLQMRSNLFNEDWLRTYESTPGYKAPLVYGKPWSNTGVMLLERREFGEFALNETNIV
jgi:hypothetical protein